ncbi:hypothetical protein PBAL39_14754 [Pedobacter sp. BAL39]|uniref:hypothetical protein n=1 Tax=Pedobacter sp. BAL39 TaxID=391596 RepID=UPI00015596CD|nr:hypothetical protein [Pedobacter sp. BAL39]EDM37694.1 hypothetical protein PBAL39_14754 [Pedobacter sp. BAL39]
MKISVLLILICAALFVQPAFSQETTFTHLVNLAEGDLNKDGLKDVAIVTQDTTDLKWPYRLQIFFGRADGKRDLMLTSMTAVEPQYPDGKGNGYIDANFDQLEIRNNVLSIKVQLTRGMFVHKFRYQNGRFELIGFTHGASDGVGTMSDIDFNLSTGDYVSREERYDTGEVISHKKGKKLIRPLPGLEYFKPFSTDWY